MLNYVIDLAKKLCKRNSNILIKRKNMHARSIRQNQGQSGIRLSIEYYLRVIRKGADEDEDESSMSGTVMISLRADEHFYPFPPRASLEKLPIVAP